MAVYYNSTIVTVLYFTTIISHDDKIISRKYCDRRNCDEIQFYHIILKFNVIWVL